LDEIICGDCLEVLGEMPDESVHLVFSSPPYNVGIDYDSHEDDKPFGEYMDWLAERFGECGRVLAPGGHLVVNVANIGRSPYLPLPARLAVRLEQEMGKEFMMRGEIVWDKFNIGNRTAWGSWLSPNMPSLRDQHEILLVFRKEGKREGESDLTKEEFLEYTRSIWTIQSESRRVSHPAPFPEALARRVVKLFSFIGETVMDPFCGSGTTCAVAKELDRHFLGIDISEEYCEIARERCSSTTLSLFTMPQNPGNPRVRAPKISNAGVPMLTPGEVTNEP